MSVKYTDNIYNSLYNDKLLIRCSLRHESLSLLGYLHLNGLISNLLYKYYSENLSFKGDSIYCILGEASNHQVLLWIDFGHPTVDCVIYHKSSIVRATDYYGCHCYDIHLSYCLSGYSFILFSKLKNKL